MPDFDCDIALIDTKYPVEPFWTQPQVLKDLSTLRRRLGQSFKYIPLKCRRAHIRDRNMDYARYRAEGVDGAPQVRGCDGRTYKCVERGGRTFFVTLEAQLLRLIDSSKCKSNFARADLETPHAHSRDAHEKKDCAGNDERSAPSIVVLNKYGGDSGSGYA